MRNRVLACATIAILAFGCMQEPKVVDITYRVSLGQSVKRVSGFNWTERVGMPVESQSLARGTVILVLPSGREVQTFSAVTFMDQKDGLVSRIVVSPLKSATTIQEVIRECARFGEDLGLSLDNLFVADIHRFSSNPPPWGVFSTVSTGGVLESKVRIYFELKPATGNDKWYLSCEITCCDDDK